MTQGVRSDALRYAGLATEAAHDARRGVAVEPATVTVAEDGPGLAVPDSQVNGPSGARRERHGGGLVAFAGHEQGAMPTLQCQVGDIGAQCLGDPQPVEGQQRRQSVIQR